ncbi:MAG TPA: hypothetical protein EYQ29_15270 [Candidatus Lambdaproteobacteria bacterium]|jgi:hypothetical protein|nr:hypothetical protein [Candidatus Lambdaproteobacteria bacterium]
MSSAKAATCILRFPWVVAEGKRELSLLRFPEGGFVGVGELRAAFGLVSAVITGTESPCL